MKIFTLICGLLLLVATCVFFFYLVPLGCAMNTTGCHQQFSVWSRIGLLYFWAPLAVAMAAIFYGSKRR